MSYYFSDDPGVDFWRWERDLERMRQELMEEERNDEE